MFAKNACQFLQKYRLPSHEDLRQNILDLRLDLGRKHLLPRQAYRVRVHRT